MKTWHVFIELWQKYQKFSKRMIPHIQVDDESNDLFGYPTLFASDANRLCCLNVDEIGKFSSKYRNVRAVKRIKIFYNNDVKGFIKKPNLAACFSEYDKQFNNN